MIDQATASGTTPHLAVRSPAVAYERVANSIHAADVDRLIALAMHREDTPAAERRRLETVRSLIAAALDLNRTLSIFLQHALVHCQGTPGSSDLDADGRAVTGALADVSARFASLSTEPPEQRVFGQSLDETSPRSREERITNDGALTRRDAVPAPLQ